MLLGYTFQFNVRKDVVHKKIKFKCHVGKVDCAANVPLYNFFGSKTQKII